MTVNGASPTSPVAVQARRCSRHPRRYGKRLAEANLEFPGHMPTHLELDKAKLSAKVTGRCEREWVALEINELLVVEYYSRKV